MGELSRTHAWALPRARASPAQRKMICSALDCCGLSHPHPLPLQVRKGSLRKGWIFHQGTSKFLGLEECVAYFLSCSFPSRNNQNNNNNNKKISARRKSELYPRHLLRFCSRAKPQERGSPVPPCPSCGLQTPPVLTVRQHCRDAGQGCRRQL